MLRVINSEKQPRSGRDRGQTAPADQEKREGECGHCRRKWGFRGGFPGPLLSFPSEISPSRGTTSCSSIKRKESPTHGNSGPCFHQPRPVHTTQHAWLPYTHACANTYSYTHCVCTCPQTHTRDTQVHIPPSSVPHWLGLKTSKTSIWQHADPLKCPEWAVVSDSLWPRGL